MIGPPRVYATKRIPLQGLKMRYCWTFLIFSLLFSTVLGTEMQSESSEEGETMPLRISVETDAQLLEQLGDGGTRFSSLSLLIFQPVP